MEKNFKRALLPVPSKPSHHDIFVWVFLMGMLMTGSAGCSRSGSGMKKAALRGKKLFALHCSGCHSGKKLDVARQPPNLAGLFQREYLPSGAPATDAQVRVTIRQGRGGIMPAFDEALSKEEIEDIIRYLHTLKVPDTLGTQLGCPPDSLAG
jgi:mono/diheme cytochrome c family protein